MFDALDVKRELRPVPQTAAGNPVPLMTPARELPPPLPGRSRRAMDLSGRIELSPGDVLFKEGDLRTTAYRVESGALCHAVAHADGHIDVIEFAFPGDMIGLGFLSRHATIATATFETRVVPVPMAALERQARSDDEIERKLAAAVETEFAVLRDRAIRSGLGKPVERLAAYLLAAASIGDNEGGGTMVWDALPSGYVAHVLGVSIDGLARGLADLEQMGLIEGAGGGIRIPNALALAVFSEPQLTSV